MGLLFAISNFFINTILQANKLLNHLAAVIQLEYTWHFT